MGNKLHKKHSKPSKNEARVHSVEDYDPNQRAEA